MVNNEGRVDLIKYPMKKFGNNLYDSIDVALPVVHGTNVEDGALQGFLKTLDIPFAGCDVLSSANDFEYINDNDEVVNRILNKIALPVIVKPINLGSSVGIKVAKTKDELVEAIEYAFNFAKQILVERVISNLKEINCSVLGNIKECKASECEEPLGAGVILSYEDKYISNKSKSGASKGMTSLGRKLPADIPEDTKKKIQDYAEATFKALNCNGVVRIDFMIDMDTDEVYVNEINTIPGSLAFYLWEASGLKYKEMLSKLIDLSLTRKREEGNLSFSYDTKILDGYNGGSKGSKN